MIYAQIKNLVIKNTIILNDLTLSVLFSEGFDAFIRIDELNPQPGVRWTYDGTSFTPPIEPEIEGE